MTFSYWDSNLLSSNIHKTGPVANPLHQRCNGKVTVDMVELKHEHKPLCYFKHVNWFVLKTGTKSIKHYLKLKIEESCEPKNNLFMTSPND